MLEFDIPNPLAQIAKLKDWEVKKLKDHEINLYLWALGEAEIDLEERLNWVQGWKGVLGDQKRARATAAAELKRRQEKYEEQVRAVQERNERLEMEHNRNTYAE